MSADKINFYTQELVFRLKNKTKIRQWLKIVAQKEAARITELSYIFCSDQYLLEINRRYLNHDTFTDIITFDNSTADGELAGDIYISIDRVYENARKFEVTEEGELLRVMIHGILHLCGYKDKHPPEKTLMRKKEDMYIALYKTLTA